MENLQLIQTNDGSSSLLNIALNETYHSTHGAIQESTHVFIKNGVQFFSEEHKPKIISILEVGFGTGLNTLLTLLFSEENKIQIDYTTLEAFPIESEVANQLNYTTRLMAKDDTNFLLLHQSAWNKRIKISEKFSFLKKKITLQEFEVQPNQFDVIFFDAFAPAKQPEMWTLPILEKIASGMNSAGVFVTYCAKGQLKRDLKSLNLAVESLPGPPGKREMVRARKP